MKKVTFKNIIVILLLLSMSLMLFACNKKGEGTGEGDGDSTGGTGKPNVDVGSFFAKGINGAVDTFWDAAQDFENTGVLGLNVNTDIEVMSKGKTDTYNIKAKGLMDMFQKDNAYSDKNGFSIDVGHNDIAVFKFVYDNDKVYLDFDGQKIEVDLFNLAKFMGGKDELFPSDDESNLAPMTKEELMKLVKDLSVFLGSVLKEGDENTHIEETNTINISFSDDISNTLIPAILTKLDESLIGRSSVQEKIDGAIKQLSEDGKLYYMDLISSAYKSSYVHHMTFDSAETAASAVANYKALREGKFNGIDTWEKHYVNIDPNDPKSIFTNTIVKANGTIDYNTMYGKPKDIETLYTSEEKRALLPQISLSISFDLDASGKLESLSVNISAAEQQITLKAVEDVEYSLYDVTGSDGAVTQKRQRVVTFAVDANGVAKDKKSFDVAAFGMKMNLNIEFTKDITLDTVKKEDYKKSNIINLNSTGELAFEKKEGGFVNYDYLIKANLNPLAFLVNADTNKIEYESKTLAEKDALIAQLKLSLAGAGYFDILINEVVGETKTESARAFFNPKETGNTNVYITFRGQKYILDVADLVNDILMDKNNDYKTAKGVAAFAGESLGDIDIVAGMDILDFVQMLGSALKSVMSIISNTAFDDAALAAFYDFVKATMDTVFVDEANKSIKITDDLFETLKGANSIKDNQLKKNILDYVAKQLFNDGKYVSLTIKNAQTEIFVNPIDITIGADIINTYKDVTPLDYLKDIKPIYINEIKPVVTVK